MMWEFRKNKGFRKNLSIYYGLKCVRIIFLIKFVIKIKLNFEKRIVVLTENKFLRFN